MTGAKRTEATAVVYELEIAIRAPRERTWRAIVDETNTWWLPDFHMVSPSSVVTFECKAGGGLVEHDDAGGSLLWYTVQMVRPAEFAVDMIGNLSPEFGGPATTNLCLRLEDDGNGGCRLKVTDGLFGHVEDSTVEALRSGWKQLFEDGLKRHVES